MPVMSLSDLNPGQTYRSLAPNLGQKCRHYMDGTYDYYCYAKPPVALTDNVWFVLRANKTGGSTDAAWITELATADPNRAAAVGPGWQYPATSLAIVAALTYG